MWTCIITNGQQRADFNAYEDAVHLLKGFITHENVTHMKISKSRMFVIGSHSYKALFFRFILMKLQICFLLFLCFKDVAIVR